VKIIEENRGVNDTKNPKSGSGKLRRAFGIDKRHDGLTIIGDELFVEDCTG
jgi:3-methyladenine DNA glycosylase Mpg